MPSYTFNVTYNGGALETQGILVVGNSLFLSVIALTTFGFVYGLGDVWFNLDSTVCQEVTWTDVALPVTTWTPIGC